MVSKLANLMKDRGDGTTEIQARIRGERKTILVDTEDVPKLFPTRYTRWYLDDCTPNGLPYAATESLVPGKRKKLHRVVMDARPGEWIGHVSNNTLDCRKSNLRRKITAAFKEDVK